VWDFFDLLFPGWWMGQATPISWPPHSQDLTLADFFFGDSWKIMWDLGFSQQWGWWWCLWWWWSGFWCHVDSLIDANILEKHNCLLIQG
jgi:hypothetical protein